MKIWTDGGCEPNPGAGGFGWVRDDGEQFCGGDLNTTNNRMEMTAILHALQQLPSGTKATVHSDSQYCVNGLTTWRSGWKRKNWLKAGKPMPNRDLWLAMEDQLNRLRVDFVWVRGHNGDVNNEMADKLATEGRLKALAGEMVQPVEVDKITPRSLLNRIVCDVEEAERSGLYSTAEMIELYALVSHVDGFFA